MNTIALDVECPACKGSGLYVGIAEKDGSAVVCHRCEGTGCYHHEYQYDDFVGRKLRRGIKRVVQVNAGICIGTGNGHKLEDFGGMLYQDWANGVPFPPGSEMRQFTCPAWWYQFADYDKKPDWHKCGCGEVFSRCPHFPEKENCWRRWDDEFGAEAKA